MDGESPKSTNIDTGGGSSIDGTVNTRGGSFTGRDHIEIKEPGTVNVYSGNSEKAILVWTVSIVITGICLGIVTLIFWSPQLKDKLLVETGTPTTELLLIDFSESPTQTPPPPLHIQSTREDEPILGPAIMGILIGELGDKYTLEITIDNPTEKDLFVTEIMITESFSNKVQCHVANPPPDYEIKLDEIIVTGDNQDGIQFDAEVRQLNPGKLKGYAFPLKGEFWASCGSFVLSMSSDIALSLGTNKFTTFFITLPKNFQLAVSGETLTTYMLQRNPQEASDHYFNLELGVYPTKTLGYMIDLLEE